MKHSRTGLSGPLTSLIRLILSMAIYTRSGISGELHEHGPAAVSRLFFFILGICDS